MTVVPVRALTLALSIVAVLGAAIPSRAQEPPPPIPHVVLDLHGNVVAFPNAVQLSDSRGLQQIELPGTGFGGDVGLHVYPFKWRVITVGIGGQATYARASRSPTAGEQVATVAVTERFTAIGSQLSLNFGNGYGWSYLSGGIGVSTWAIVPNGAEPLPQDSERLKTINYGGGARWFMKSHLAFSFDVRFHAINPSMSGGGYPGSPRTTLLVANAGISLK
jgi:hypothetical protein